MILCRYQTASGRVPFSEWLGKLKDLQAKAHIQMKLTRLMSGNLGDCKRLSQGVSELRIDHGPGYRVYFSRLDEITMLLLCGGDKRTQVADIERALNYLKDFRRRTE